jgi:hypothetical protein
VDYARDEAEDRKDDVDPEVLADPHLQKHPKRWQEYRDYDAKQIHRTLSVYDRPRLTFLLRYSLPTVAVSSPGIP